MFFLYIVLFCLVIIVVFLTLMTVGYMLIEAKHYLEEEGIIKNKNKNEKYNWEEE